jgi:alkylation response protein AidB-like acyl-CoA dehydrogenase
MPIQIATDIGLDHAAIARELAQAFAETAVERDRRGGTPLAERDRLRQSGLLKALIPTQLGGAGLSWREIFPLVREFAKVDASIAHVLSYHYLGLTIPLIFGTPEQQSYFLGETARQNWFWCNALNPLDRRTRLTAEGEGYRLSGRKSFCSGSHDSDVMPITAQQAETGELVILLLPTRREGILLFDDWDNMGQRQTDSGTVEFQQVRVEPLDVVPTRERIQLPFGTIRTCLAQLNLANIYLGIAQGALEAARDYTLTQSRPWLTSGVDAAHRDPYVLYHYGELAVALEAADALIERAIAQVDGAWQQRWDLSAEGRGDCAVAIATAKVAATQVGLTVAKWLFDVTGARATSRQLGFDRYWRNLRTFTLHDPVDYKLRDLGNWWLKGEFPQPSFYD